MNDCQGGREGSQIVFLAIIHGSCISASTAIQGKIWMVCCLSEQESRRSEGAELQGGGAFMSSLMVELARLLFSLACATLRGVVRLLLVLVSTAPACLARLQ